MDGGAGIGEHAVGSATDERDCAQWDATAYRAAGEDAGRDLGALRLVSGSARTRK